MPIKSLTVSAPSRLHFGLLSIGDQTKRKFGGAGLMINGPRTEVRVSASERFILHANADLRDTAAASVANWHARLAPAEIRNSPVEELPVEMKIDAAPRHCGLGSGTQLAFSIATALQLAFNQPLPSSEDLALAMGRGKRSAIGSYGFHQGGFLVDRGIANEEIAPLDMRIEFPYDWHVVLIEPKTKNGEVVFGAAETDAFQKLPSTTQAEADYLASLLGQHIVPSILAEDFSHFAASVTEFGYRSGMFYSPVQGGAYASDASSKIVNIVASMGEFAVGQSSWGPTVFAIVPLEKKAYWLVDKIREHGQDVVGQTTVVSADNHGMKVRGLSN